MDVAVSPDQPEGMWLMQFLEANKIPWTRRRRREMNTGRERERPDERASSCHGDGVCAKCRIKIVHGLENLSPPNETEIFLVEKFQIAKDDRISCQTNVLGDLEITTGYW